MNPPIQASSSDSSAWAENPLIERTLHRTVEIAFPDEAEAAPLVTCLEGR